MAVETAGENSKRSDYLNALSKLKSFLQIYGANVSVIDSNSYAAAGRNERLQFSKGQIIGQFHKAVRMAEGAGISDPLKHVSKEFEKLLESFNSEVRSALGDISNIGVTIQKNGSEEKANA